MCFVQSQNESFVEKRRVIKYLITTFTFVITSKKIFDTFEIELTKHLSPNLSLR